MSINGKDREVLRDLAKRVAEIVALPVQAERRALWKRHNALERVRPMILVFPEGSWRELLPDTSLTCGDKRAREIERTLRVRLYTHEHFRDDTVIERTWVVSKAVSHTGWGLEPKFVPSTVEHGAWGFDPVILEPRDLAKLKLPEIVYDEELTARNLAEAQDLFGDILDVRLRGVCHVSFHLMSLYCRLRGLMQVMMDMIENPSMLHDAMTILEAGDRGIVRQYEELNVLDLNNDGTYHSSGGVGYTDELPADGFDAKHVRPRDMWASAESQELAQVSPAMHREFALDYEARLLEPFGLTGYGCCEDLALKLDDVLKLPRIRRISIAPSADVARCAEKLGERAIFSWKAKPQHLVGTFDEGHIRQYIADALGATRGCVVEMILKDTHTCEHHPERFTRWTGIAREEVEAM